MDRFYCKNEKRIVEVPEVSVIVPIYNVELYLSRCIDSILAQTFTDFELILVDDGSPDKCGEICDKYAAQDKRIHVIHKENGGLSDARNAGIEWTLNNTSCLWITFVDSDDWVHPEYLEILYKVCKDENVKVCACGYIRVKGQSSEGITLVPPKKTILSNEDFFCNYPGISVISCAKLFHISLFINIRFPRGRIHEDEFTTYKLLFSCELIGYINYQLYFYFENDKSITRSKWTPKQMDYFEAVSQQIDFFETNHYPRALKNAIYWYAHTLCDQMETISDNKEYQKYYQKMQKMFQTFIKKYGRDFFPFKENYRYYEYAFPKRMKIYWDIKGIIGKN